MFKELLFGIFVTALSQVAEVEPYSNAISFKPESTQETVAYLNEIDNSMVPIVGIDYYYLGADGKYSYKDPAPLKAALRSSDHYSKLIFMWDEPCWRGRNNNQSCQEILDMMSQVKADFPGVEVFHVEAWAELQAQMIVDGKMHLFLEAEHIGFDCYSDFFNCAGLTHLWYLSNILAEIEAGNSNAKLFLVPGAYLGEGNHMNTQEQVVQHIQDYTNFTSMYFERCDCISGLGFFTWGNLAGIYGAKNYVPIQEALINSYNTLKKED